MIRKFPIIRPDIRFKDIIFSLKTEQSRQTDEFNALLAGSVSVRHGFLVNSGIAAFYLILEALKKKSSRTEVVLPAYTAGSLVVAVRKAGLKPVLCDITKEDYNADLDNVLKVISGQTLAIVAVHMFGIPIADIAEWKDKIPKEVFFIEDCCQAMDAKVRDRAVGSFGDISFFSFNRGKNFSILGGGWIATDNEELAKALNGVVTALSLHKTQDKSLAVALALYRCGTDPFMYGIAHAFAGRFKENAPPKDIPVGLLSTAKKALGAHLFKHLQGSALARYRNGTFLLDTLSGIEWLGVPKIAPYIFPVFNRLPLLFADKASLQKKKSALWRAGFETSQMYIRPLHGMFDLGYSKGAFPIAEEVAEQILTLPVYQGLTRQDLEKICEVIKQ